VLGALLVAAYLVWVAVHSTSGHGSTTLISFRVLDDTRVEARYTVALEPGDTVRCTLEALDARHGEVGVLEEDIGPSATGFVERTTVIRTTGRAVTATVGTCPVLPR
ncbi:DUF4307 domain-containing protein, partial [Kineococcus glutinatus]|uniref:DUF4307 domain-containing protein n=1 Tax=Kineococcus glutinatus TaxID=1070872 RepID=UPI0031E9C2D4